MFSSYCVRMVSYVHVGYVVFLVSISLCGIHGTNFFHRYFID